MYLKIITGSARLFSFRNDYAAMKSSNACTPLININRHYVTSNVTLLNKYNKLKLL